MENEKKINPAGEVDEKELKEISDVETPEGGTAGVAITSLISAAGCPTLKCTSKCS